MNAFFSRTVGTAVKGAFGFHPMADNLDPAVRTAGRQGMNGTFKAIEGVGGSLHDDIKRFIVIVSANFTLGHYLSPDSPFSRERRRQTSSDQIWPLPSPLIEFL
jgi:hypothetical protein